MPRCLTIALYGAVRCGAVRCGCRLQDGRIKANDDARL